MQWPCLPLFNPSYEWHVSWIEDDLHVNKSEWSLPEATSTILTPVRPGTWRGTALCSVEPMPNCPSWFQPQDQTLPSAVKIRLWPQPELIFTACCPNKASTNLGIDWSLPSPWPSWKLWPLPQEYTFPFLDTIVVCARPPLALKIASSFHGPLMRSGVTEVNDLSGDSSWKPARPQLYKWPCSIKINSLLSVC